MDFSNLANKALNRANAKYNERILSEVNPEGKAHKPAFYAGDGQSLVLGNTPVSKPIITTGSIKIGDPIIDRGFSIYATPRVKKPEEPDTPVVPPKTNIKYVYFIYQDGVARCYVGGHQKQNIEITPVPASLGENTKQYFPIAINNTGTNDFLVQLVQEFLWTTVGSEPVIDGGRVSVKQHYDLVTNTTKETIIKTKRLLPLTGEPDNFRNSTLVPNNITFIGEQTNLNTTLTPYHYCGYGFFSPFDPMRSPNLYGGHLPGSDGYWYAGRGYESGDMIRTFHNMQTYETEFFGDIVGDVRRNDYDKILYPGAPKIFDNPYLYNIRFGFEGEVTQKRIAMCSITPDGKQSLGLLLEGLGSNYQFFTAKNNALTMAPAQFKTDLSYTSSVSTIRHKFDWQKSGKFTALDCNAANTLLYNRYYGTTPTEQVELEYRQYNSNLTGGTLKKVKVWPIDQEGDFLTIVSYGVYEA